jgi:hypothetical protein
MVNVRMRVFNKTTGALLAGPVQVSQLFASAGITDQCGTVDDGDPIVLYDQLADRWLISQFAVSAAPSRECIAISKTPDPTGQWFVYSFASPNPVVFADYPKIGLWPDAYYMTTNEFNFAGTVFLGTGVYAYEREKMLAGDPGARIVYFDLSTTAFPEAIGGMLPGDLDGLRPPPAGEPNPFSYFTATAYGDPANGLRMFNFHVDWVTTASSTFTEFGTTYAAPLPVAAFDPLASSRSQIPQPGTTSGLDAISDRLMHRMQYRNFGSYQTLVTNHTVNVGTGLTISTYQGAPRWYELRKMGGPWSVNQQGTFAPDAQVPPFQSRWMASAAMDASGNIAVGYSASSSVLNPSIKYAARLASDPSGQLSQGEATMFSGLGSQTGTSNRWGDYTDLVLDTDDCTYYYVNQYQPTGVTSFNWRTRIGRFNLGPNACTPPERGTAIVNVTSCSSGLPLAGASVSFDGNFYGPTNAAGVFTTSMLPGSYSVLVSAPALGSASGTLVVPGGGNGVINLCLSGVPVIRETSFALQVESCPPANGAVDPEERVTYALTLSNVGIEPTTNLVATLMAGPNVSSPSEPQSYGMIPPGGSATRNFSWTAVGSCGAPWTATIGLLDGTLAFPNATITGTYGALVVTTAFSENFDGVVAPALPAGWTAVNAVGLDGILWVTSTTTPDTAPNAAFVNDPSSVHDKRLDTPVIAIPASGTFQLKFRHRWALETNFDGGVLEASVDAGPFTDILAAGGSFVSGGYNATISTSFSSPIAGRQAWSGSFNTAYTNTVVNLPGSFSGHNVQFRFRMGSDNSVAATGWRVDTITVDRSERVCSSSCTLVRLEVSTTLSRNGPNVDAVVTVSNTGGATASAVSLTTAQLGSTNGTPLPQALGSIPAGGSVSATVHFAGVPPGASVLKIAGSSGAGSFSSSRRVSVP